MKTLDFIISRGARQLSGEPDGSDRMDRLARHHTWIAVGVGVAGVAAGAYGANKQSKDNKAAQAQNAEQQEEQNRQAWANYLMTRGINPAGAQTGAIPTNPQAINSRLPLWANVKRSGVAPQGFRLGGGGTNPRLSMGTQFTQPVASQAEGSGAATGGGSKNSKTKDILIGNPLGIGGKDRSFLDPLGIF